MTRPAGTLSPLRYARICGVLYLYIIAAGTGAELFVRSRLVVWADAEATAANIRAHETLFRAGFSAELLHLAGDVAVAMLLYVLLGPVHRGIALLAAWMRLACDILLAGASLSHFAALRLLADAADLKSFAPEQLHTLALLAMKLHGDAYAISLVFFGFACLSLGYLAFRSRFLPRALGVALAIAGTLYLFHSFARFLSPAFAATLFPALFVPIFLAELSFALWLLGKGVDVEKWKESAGREGG